MLAYYYRFINNLKSSPARKDLIMIISFALALIANILIWLLIYIKLRPTVYNLPTDQTFIPLHYNIYLGIDNFGRWEKIFILPGIGLLFLLINFLIAFIIYNKKKILSYFLCIITPFIEIILLVSTLFIVLINI